MIVLVALVGLAVGSFTCVVIDRLPIERSEPAETGELWTSRPWREVLGGTSRCSSCGAGVRPRDNIPVVGWLLLRGRCRDCGERIPAFHPVVEIGVAAVAALMYVRLDGSWQLLPALWLVAPAIAIAAIDWRTMIVPTRLVWPTSAVSVATVVVASVAAGESWWLAAAGIGALTASAPLFLLWYILPSHLGFGDVRLCVLLGLHTGVAAAPLSDRPLVIVLAAVFLLTIGAGAGLVLGLVTQVGFGRPLPFGPTLVGAALCMVAFAPGILGPWVASAA